jgi:hypothetical protein
MMLGFYDSVPVWSACALLPHQHDHAVGVSPVRLPAFALVLSVVVFRFCSTSENENTRQSTTLPPPELVARKAKTPTV